MFKGVVVSRHRAGATASRVWQDAAYPDRIVEQSVVASRDEHLRRHERVTRRNAERLAKIGNMTDPGRPAVGTHWLTSARGTLTSRFWTGRASK
jgi:hypothetical protein